MAKKSQNRELARHQQLPDMSRRAFIGFVSNAVQRNVAKHDPESGKRHQNRHKSARLSQDCGEGIGNGFHVASLRWVDMLVQCRAEGVGGSANLCAKTGAGMEVFFEEKRFEFRSVALPPRARIKAREETGKCRTHKASSLFSPAWVK